MPRYGTYDGRQFGWPDADPPMYYMQGDDPPPPPPEPPPPPPSDPVKEPKPEDPQGQQEVA